MKPLSPPAWLQTLNAPEGGVVARALGRVSDDFAVALQSLEEAEDWRLLPHVLPLAFARQRDVAARGLDAVRRLVRTTPVEHVGRLAKEVRQLYRSREPYSPTYPAGWMQLSADDVRRDSPRWDEALVAMCTLHHSGWVRAASLEELGRRSTGWLLPYLVLRVTDWVASVRTRALELCERSMGSGNEAHWVQALPVVHWISRTERGAAAAMESQVRTYLATDAGRGALDAATRSAEVTVRRAAWRFVLAGTTPPRGDQLARGILDRDPQVSLLLAAKIPLLRGDPAMEPVLRAGVRSRQPLVRRHCLDALAADVGAGARDELLAALADRSGVVRGVARYYSLRLGLVADFGSYYGELLGVHAPAKVAVAIEALGEIRAADRWPLVRPFLWARHRGLRRAALAVGMAFDVPDLSDWLWEALADDAPSISNFARRSLAGRLAMIEVNRAARLATNRKRAETARLNATRLLGVVDKWKQPPALLRVVTTTEGSVAALALELLWRWYANSSWAQPTAADLTAMVNALDEAQAALPEPLTTALRFAMKPWLSELPRPPR